MQGALEERPRPEAGYSTPKYDSPIHRLPVETLMIIFTLATLSRTRQDLYTTVKLTHVCRQWRESLIYYPRAWTSIFATQEDCPGFIQACFERSQPLPIEITVDVGDKQRVARNFPRRTLYSSALAEEYPYERHVVFKLIDNQGNANRVQALHGSSFIPVSSGRPRLFRLLLPQLTTLEWEERLPMEALAPGQRRGSRPFPGDRLALKFPKLRSLTFRGPWNCSICKIRNLTSFALTDLNGSLHIEDFRQFLLRNKTLVSLEVSTEMERAPRGAPVDLPNLKSLTFNYSTALSTIIHVPALRHLSTLRISPERCGDMGTLHASGDGISLVGKFRFDMIVRHWEILTKDARPTIRHLRLFGEQPDCIGPCFALHRLFAIPMEDATTLDLGLNFSRSSADLFWGDLVRVGLRLKTIRFEIPEVYLPCGQSGDPSTFGLNSLWWDRIAELVELRSRYGRPLSTVERIIVTEDEEVNRLQDLVWERFLEDKDIARWLVPP
jgi:hypothetical protein